MIHFSVDDTINVFKDLFSNNYSSIFENDTLCFFKKLYEKYNFKVSMYCFYEDEDGFNIGMCDGRYQKEFSENSVWLKFGFHARGSETHYKKTDADVFLKDLKETLNALETIVSESALTFDVRLGFGEGKAKQISSMKKAFPSFKVLYGVDDDRVVYHLLPDENDILVKTGEFYDEKLDVMVKMSETRLESVKENTEVTSAIKENKINVFFTHESFLARENIREKIQLLCDSGQEFAF